MPSPATETQTVPEIRSPVIKAGTAIGAAVGANTGVAADVALKAAEQVANGMQSPELFWTIVSLPWGSIASMVAALYTMALFSEWLYKKPIRWLLIKLRIIKPSVVMTESEWSSLRESSKYK